MTISTSTLALIIDALASLKAGRNVLIVAHDRPYAFGVAGLLVRIARHRAIPCANLRGSALDAPWVYARGHDDPIELLSAHCDVFTDRSARGGRQHVPPPKHRRSGRERIPSKRSLPAS